MPTARQRSPRVLACKETVLGMDCFFLSAKGYAEARIQRRPIMHWEQPRDASAPTRRKSGRVRMTAVFSFVHNSVFPSQACALSLLSLRRKERCATKRAFSNGVSGPTPNAKTRRLEWAVTEPVDQGHGLHGGSKR